MAIDLTSHHSLMVRQRKELGEILLNFESRNKYEIQDAGGNSVGFAAEQGKGFLATVARQVAGHWRSFDIHVFSAARELQWIAHHPFRFFFQRLEVNRADGVLVGAVQQRWGFLYKRFDVEGPNGVVHMTMAAPRWKVWSFPFKKDGRDVATVKKKWSGGFKELLTDADNFKVDFSSDALTQDDRTLVLAAALFIDLIFFETKA